jgi:hypothetical protein
VAQNVDPEFKPQYLNWENNSMYGSINENKYWGNKFNKKYKIHVVKSVKYYWKKLQKT